MGAPTLVLVIVARSHAGPFGAAAMEAHHDAAHVFPPHPVLAPGLAANLAEFPLHLASASSAAFALVLILVVVSALQKGALQVRVVDQVVEPFRPVVQQRGFHRPGGTLQL